MSGFKLNFLDHVAIRVRDVETSVLWYEKVLGLKRYQLKKWGSYPVFMLSGTSGIAIFPANPKDPKLDSNSKNIKIDHFAFNVTQEDFKKAQEVFKSLKISFEFQDHFYFHSIYLKDPDDHTVELTTLLVPESSFYNKDAYE
ncbi:MAG: VOC family protein [Muriicola sp.]|nr:VOC family protein [Muriicola sp.]